MCAHLSGIAISRARITRAALARIGARLTHTFARSSIVIVVIIGVV